MFHGEVFLGEMEVFPMKQGGEGGFPFPSNEIRVSHLSPPSERCPPLAILQTIAPFSVRCKLQSKLMPPLPSLHRLYHVCFNEFKVCPHFSFEHPRMDMGVPCLDSSVVTMLI